MIKATGEKRASKQPVYKCQRAQQGIPHDGSCQFRAEEIEPVISERSGRIWINCRNMRMSVRRLRKAETGKGVNEKRNWRSSRRRRISSEGKLRLWKENLPDAMAGEYPLSLGELAALIRKQKEALERQELLVREKEQALGEVSVSAADWEKMKKEIPSWRDVFYNADGAAKRVLVNRLIRRIEVKKDEITVYFKVNPEDFS